MKSKLTELAWTAAAFAAGMVLYQILGPRITSLFSKA